MNEMKISESINRLREMIKKGTSPYHVVWNAAEQLSSAGFRELRWEEEWKPVKGNAYYTVPFGTSLFAFRVNEGFSGKDQIRMISSHVDSPGLRVKAKAEYPYKNYQRLNAEVYGGAIYNTWMDRPLGMAGTVVLKGNDSMQPTVRYLDCGRPLFVVPNLSIHMNRDINKGVELNPQVDMLPLAGLKGKAEEAFFTEVLAEELYRSDGRAVNKEDILSYDLGLYMMQEGMVCGINDDLLTAPRLDNLTSVQASLTALMESGRTEGVDFIALLDHEEIGSRSKNGGAGNLLPFVWERVYAGLGMSREEYLRGIGNGFLISADTAHALHPAHPEKYDPTSCIQLGDGVAIKCASKQSYAGDGESWAILKGLGEKYDIPCTFNYIRSDIPGGSTLGPVISAALPMRSADIGVPLLAMHSAMETMACRDQYELERFLTAFFRS